MKSPDDIASQFVGDLGRYRRFVGCQQCSNGLPRYLGLLQVLVVQSIKENVGVDESLSHARGPRRESVDLYPNKAASCRTVQSFPQTGQYHPALIERADPAHIGSVICRPAGHVLGSGREGAHRYSG